MNLFKKILISVSLGAMCTAVPIVGSVITNQNFNVVQVQAASAVKVSLSKKGVLTVSGSGTVTKKNVEQAVKNSDKVKKIVIKKGITKIGKRVFEDCYYNTKEIIISNSVKSIGKYAIGEQYLRGKWEKLKKVTMPGKLKLKQDETYKGIYLDTNVCQFGEKTIVKFNTDIDLKTAKHIYCGKFVAKKSDKKYSTAKGAIYTKNGKKLILVPSDMKKFVAGKECTVVDLKKINSYKVRGNKEEIKLDWGEFGKIYWGTGEIVLGKKVKQLKNTKSLHGEITKVNSAKLDKKSMDFLFKKYDGAKIVDMFWENKLLKRTKSADGTIGFTVKNRAVQLKGKGTVNVSNGILTIGGNASTPDATTLKRYCKGEKINRVVIKNGIKNISDKLFKDCGNITAVEFPNSLHRVGKYAFYNTGLTKIENSVQLEGIDSYAFAKTKLTEIELGASCWIDWRYWNNSWGAGDYEIGDSKGAFSDTPLRKVVFSDMVEKIPARCFENCSQLTCVNIPEGVGNIGEYAFAGTAITEIVVPEGLIDKAYTVMGFRAFERCKNLKTVTIPGAANTLEREVFYKCDKLETVRFNTDFDEKISVCLDVGKNWEVSSRDKKFKSVDGMIYTKDGKTLVRIPAGRTEAIVSNQCTTVCTSAIFYSNLIYKGSMEQWDYELAIGKTLKKLEIPKSVTKIDDKKYQTETDAGCDNSSVLTNVIVYSQNLSDKNVNTLMSYLKKLTGTNGKKIFKDSDKSKIFVKN